MAVTNIVFSQDRQEYYLEIKEGFELGTIQKTTNPDETLTFSMSNASFAQSLNEQPIFEFDRKYPTAQTPRLQRIYKLEVSNGFTESDLLVKDEVKKLFLIDETEIVLNANNLSFDLLPNDYEDVVTGGRNTALDIIKMPLAWNITTGDQSLLVGVSDGATHLDHEDLLGQIFDTIEVGTFTGSHGVGVTGIISAKANNGSHIPGIAHDTQVVFAYTNGGASSVVEGLSQLINYPNVKVINCSWSFRENQVSSALFQDLEDCIAEAEDNNIVIVGAAGNDGYSTYEYPASFDTTLSVTGTGHRYPIGFIHDLDDFNNGNIWPYASWKDVFLIRPHVPGNLSSMNYNDKIDVTAPDQLNTNISIDYANHPDGYKISGSGTSQAAPFVTAIAGLIFSVNPNFSASQVREIIRETADDIYYIPQNQPYIGQLGTGRINAYRAVLTADCMTNPRPGLDLAMQNSKLDYFEEPDVNTQQPWHSEDIWVRNQNDGILACGEHQNPEYDPNNPNYAYVQVTNNSCVTSSGNDVLKLYWAKASTSLAWPDPWDGSVTIYDEVDEVDVLR